MADRLAFNIYLYGTRQAMRNMTTEEREFYEGAIERYRSYLGD